MAQDAVELVKGFFSEQLTDWPGKAFDLLAEDVVLAPSTGEIYVGHEGYAQWYESYVQRYERSAFIEASYEDLDGGWVLACGAANSHRRDGHEERQPGYWLTRVRDGAIAAVLYFRTEEEARAALRR